MPRLLPVLLLLLATAVNPGGVRAQDTDADHAAVEAEHQDAPAEHAQEADLNAAGDEHAQDAEHAAGEAGHGEEGDHGPLPPLWLVLPFMTILLMIATGPLFYAHHWHHHYPKYSVGLGVIVALYYVFGMGNGTPIVHAIQEYMSFIALVASLFIAASGIYVSVNAKGSPVTNTILLFVASVIANLIATTGSAMLFIRCYMRLNTGRLKAYHIVFFIFLVANVGGALTPIGDPPLFLGFLRGVPFFWTMAHVWHIWLFATVLILGVFFVIDSRNKDEAPDPDPDLPLISLQGSKAFIWVAVIIGSVFIDPNIFPDVVPDLYAKFHIPFGIREIIMFAVAFGAYQTANKEVMEKNEFNFEPIREVGWLFLGIFATMQPALQLISAFASSNADSLSVGTFYWGTGALSGILDNAPTYLNFLAAAMGKFGMDVNAAASVVAFSEGMDSAIYLQAISVAAVFFGAMSYIGNAPNFMVKAIAESNGVETPSFMGYIIRYSIPILLPIYFIIYLVFFSGWL
ncbi:MAG: Na+/H+ antiporter NhaD/arsenite permease-like protein [Rhodothermales bacterium]|jgi:Na+/H+ antiporter NhaD/arsenite permease-like protein